MFRIKGQDQLLVGGEGIECQVTEPEFYLVGSGEPWKPSAVTPEWLAD